MEQLLMFSLGNGSKTGGNLYILFVNIKNMFILNHYQKLDISK